MSKYKYLGSFSNQSHSIVQHRNKGLSRMMMMMMMAIMMMKRKFV